MWGHEEGGAGLLGGCLGWVPPCLWGELGWGCPGELGAPSVGDVGLFPTGWLPLAPLGALTHFPALELIKSE